VAVLPSGRAAGGAHTFTQWKNAGSVPTVLVFVSLPGQ
jgi:hypothetical protein